MELLHLMFLINELQVMNGGGKTGKSLVADRGFFLSPAEDTRLCYTDSLTVVIS